MIKNKYNRFIYYIQIDEETFLNKNFKRFTAERDIITEQSVSVIQIQNDTAEYSEEIIVIKAHYIYITVRLSDNLWSEIV